jgi:proteasome accessory factor B
MKTAARFSLQRIVALDRAIRAGEYPNAMTIARELEVGHRTVQRDVEFFRDRLGAPLGFDRRRNGYYYTKENYQLPLMKLTEGELIALFLAERVLQQYRGTPYAHDLSKAFDKITAGLSSQVTVDLAHFAEGLSFRTTTASDMDAALFGELDAAIQNRRRLAIRYYSASRGEETAREVDPYHLASVDGHWYLVAKCHLREEIRMFTPSRIRSLTPTGHLFDRPDNFRINDYLSQSFGVLRGTDGENYCVRLRFSGEAVKYIGERIWHASQKFEQSDEDHLILELKLGHLREVERFALSWGSCCEVLEPLELRDKMRRDLSETAKYYSNPSIDP